MAPSVVRPDILRQIHLLQHLDEPTLQAIADKTRMVEFTRQQSIIQQDDEDRSVYFVQKGSVKVAHNAPNGKTVTFRVLRRGDVFGELSAIDGMPRSSSVSAQSSCTLLVIRASSSSTWLSLPGLAEALLTYLTGLVRALSKRVQDDQYPARCRILNELLELARSEGRKSKDEHSIIINPAPSQQELAGQLGTNREAISREFSASTNKAFSNAAIAIIPSSCWTLISSKGNGMRLSGNRETHVSLHCDGLYPGST